MEMKLQTVDFTDPATLADSIVKRGGPVPRLPDVPAEYTFIEFGGAGDVGRGSASWFFGAPALSRQLPLTISHSPLYN
jgi:hypothetical protein